MPNQKEKEGKMKISEYKWKRIEGELACLFGIASMGTIMSGGIMTDSLIKQRDLSIERIKKLLK